MSTLPVLPQKPALSLPQQMRAGDLFAWSVQTQNLATGSAVSYILTGVVGNGAVRILIPPVPVDSFGLAAFSLPSTVTAAWNPARYVWVCFAFDATGNRTELGEGQLWVQPDPNAAVIADPRSKNEILLANIRALLDGKALEDAVMYKIGSRELTKMPIKDLLYWEGVVEGRVRKERRRSGQLGGTTTIGIMFGGR